MNSLARHHLLLMRASPKHLVQTHLLQIPLDNQHGS